MDNDRRQSLPTQEQLTRLSPTLASVISCTAGSISRCSRMQFENRDQVPAVENVQTPLHALGLHRPPLGVGDAAGEHVRASIQVIETGGRGHLAQRSTSERVAGVDDPVVDHVLVMAQPDDLIGGRGSELASGLLEDPGRIASPFQHRSPGNAR
jgi:hypothetical protein